MIRTESTRFSLEMVFFKKTELHCQQVKNAFYPLKKRILKMSLEDQLKLIENLDLIDI